MGPGPSLVMTPDLEVARRFYRDALGLTLIGEGPGQLVFDLAPTRLVVFACARAAPAHEHATDAGSVITFEVADLNDAMRDLQAKGVRFIHATPGVNDALGLRYAAFHAPGGNVHELVQATTA